MQLVTFSYRGETRMGAIVPNDAQNYILDFNLLVLAGDKSCGDTAGNCECCTVLFGDKARFVASRAESNAE